MKKYFVFFLVLTFVLSLSVIGMAKTPKNILVVGDRIDAVSLDPAVAYEFSSVNTCMNAYDTLIIYKAGDFSTPYPGIAESWEVSPDGLTWTFHLKKGVRFASGNELTAEDVVYSFKRAMAINKGPAWILQENVKDIKAVDKYTVAITIKQPSAYFISTLYNPVAAVVDSKVVKAHEKDGDWGEGWLTDHSAGSGPFIIKSWERNVGITLVKNPNYWGPAPKVDKVLIRDIKEANTQKMMLEKGDLDMSFGLTNEMKLDLKNNSDIKMVKGVNLRIGYLGMNILKKPLDNVKVRQAIRNAIDYDAIVNKLAKGIGIRMEGVIIKGLLGYRPSLGIYGYNPEKAKQLMKEAGYEDGFEITLTTSSGSSSMGLILEDLGALIQSNLAAIGIKVKLQFLAGSAYLQLYRNKKTELNIGVWGADYPDPHNFVQPFGRTGGSLAKRLSYSNPALDKIIDKAAVELDPISRAKLYDEAQKILCEDGPYAFLMQPEAIIPMRVNIKGYEYDPLNIYNFRGIYKE